MIGCYDEPTQAQADGRGRPTVVLADQGTVVEKEKR